MQVQPLPAERLASPVLTASLQLLEPEQAESLSPAQASSSSQPARLSPEPGRLSSERPSPSVLLRPEPPPASPVRKPGPTPDDSKRLPAMACLVFRLPATPNRRLRFSVVAL